MGLWFASGALATNGALAANGLSVRVPLSVRVGRRRGLPRGIQADLRGRFWLYGNFWGLSSTIFHEAKMLQDLSVRDGGE